MGRAEGADRENAPNPQRLPEELSRRENLRVKLGHAYARLEQRAQARAGSKWAGYERKAAARERRRGSHQSRHVKSPREGREATQQNNLTDANSSLMRKSKRHEYRQAYNAQAVVDAEGSQLVLGSQVSACASDRNELVADVDAIRTALGTAGRVSAENGYAMGGEVAQLEHRALYRILRQTVEPVFGIDKQAMGFRQLLLRGIDKVQGEWGLVMLAYNCGRLHNLAGA